jgi:hypothetical protein
VITLPITNKPPFCRIFIHNWSKWGKIKQYHRNEGTMLEDVRYCQESKCKDCNAIRVREVM